jgi:hypothetical protein
MKTGRRPRLPNTQTPEERALWETIRAQLSQRRSEKRQKYGLHSNREADLYVPTIVSARRRTKPFLRDRSKF